MIKNSSFFLTVKKTKALFVLKLNNDIPTQKLIPK